VRQKYTLTPLSIANSCYHDTIEEMSSCNREYMAIIDVWIRGIGVLDLEENMRRFMSEET
jgi:hypothetical protein